MINRLQFVQSIGQFDAATGGAQIALAQEVLIYAENGRGKTTLTAILRSLASGLPLPISERRRLGSANSPHAVIQILGGAAPAVFQNGAWSQTFPNLAIFDDVFVDRNIYSGLAVEPAHRQGLHDLILGAQGVALNQQLQAAIAQVTAQTTAMRDAAAGIPAAARGPFSVDDFCAVQPMASVQAAIVSAEQSLAAAQQSAAIQANHPFDQIVLPQIDVAALTGVLGLDLPALEGEAAARVQTHFTQLGGDSEAWVAAGVQKLPQDPSTPADCPFCAQDLAGSELIGHYRAYFSEAYSNLRQQVADAVVANGDAHSGNAPIAFERAVRVAIERRQFWAKFCEVHPIVVDTESIVAIWRAALAAIATILTSKQQAPLEKITFSEDVLGLIAAYEAQRATIGVLNQELVAANVRIAAVKAQAAAGNVAVLQLELAKLQATQMRHAQQGIVTSCGAYSTAKTAKALAEQQRDAARSALDAYRAAVFPALQAAMNVYLAKFNAGFRLDSVAPVNVGGGSVCNYNVLINNLPVSVAGGVPVPGSPSFKNTLSAGDRTTLALSFFLASLDRDPALASKVVVIDDPISSLDEHRALTTVQEVRRLVDRCRQVIVLSHNKPFLCELWQHADPTMRTALEVGRVGNASDLRPWNVDLDCVTLHDRRHSMLREYVVNGGANTRDVAAAIRPTLEAFLRVAFPERYVPGTLLGPFRGICQQQLGTAGQLLNAVDIQELQHLTDYGNRFHHDTNPAGYQTVAINDAELSGFVGRTLNFAKR